MKKVSIFRMFLLIVIYSLVANFAHPITPTLFQNLGVHDYMFGVAFASMSITYFLFSPFWGKISETYGSAKVSTFCLFGYALGQLLFMIAVTESAIIVARLIAGFFISGIMVNQLIYVVQNSPLEKRAGDLAMVASLSAVFSPFGFLIGGFLGDISLRLTFIAQVIGLVVIGILCWLFLDDKPSDESISLDQIIKASNPFQAVKEARGLITAFLLVFFAIAALTSFASNCYEQCFNYFTVDQFGFLPSNNGLLKAAIGFVTLLANSTICNWLLKKTNVRLSLIPVLGICLAMMTAIVLIDDMWLFIVINVIFFSFNAVYLPLIQAILGEVSQHNSGILVGLYNSARSLGMVAGSLFAGFIYVVDPRYPFVFTAVAFALATVAAIVNYRQTPNK